MKNETYRRWEKLPPSSFQQRAQKLRSGDFLVSGFSIKITQKYFKEIFLQ